MSVWLTPDLKPFFGGTYFPPKSQFFRRGFEDVLKIIADQVRLVLDGAICLADSFELTIYHRKRLKAFRHE